MLAAFWGMLVQLAVSPFNWIGRVIKEAADKANRMVNKEAAHRSMEEVQSDANEDADMVT